MVDISCDSQNLWERNPCWQSVRMLWWSRCLIVDEWTICSSILLTNGVIKLLKDLNPHKASEPDQIPTRLLKLYASELAPAVVRVFQTSLVWFAKSLRAKPVLTVCQNVMMVKMSHCRWMDNMFKYFAYYWCKWNRTIVGCNVSFSLYKQRGDARSNSDKPIEVICFRVSPCRCSRFPNITGLWYCSM
jgi:hypothetical protein